MERGHHIIAQGDGEERDQIPKEIQVLETEI